MNIINIRDLTIPSVKQIQNFKLAFKIVRLLAIIGCAISFYLVYFFSTDSVLISLASFFVGALCFSSIGFIEEFESAYVEISTDGYKRLKKHINNEGVKAYLDAVHLSGRLYIIAKEEQEIKRHIYNEDAAQKLEVAREAIFSNHQLEGGFPPNKAAQARLPIVNAETPVCNPWRFFAWLSEGLRNKSIEINQAGSMVQIVDEGVFLLAPAIFQAYLVAHGEEETKHRILSRKFSRLRKHIKCGAVNIHGYWIYTRKNSAVKINGWLLPLEVVYGSNVKRPPSNPYLYKQLIDTVEYDHAR